MKKKALIPTMLRLLLLVLMASTLCGCSRWEKDFSKAKKMAAKTDKDILCVVTGSSWQSQSGAFKANIVDSKIFYRQAKDLWVLMNIDLKDKESLPAELSSFNIDFENDFPAVFLLSRDGYYISKIKDTSVIATPTNLFDAIKEIHLEYEAQSANLKKIRTVSGPDKSISINKYYFSLPFSYRPTALPLVEELLANDPNNKSGVVGLFQVERAYLKSLALAREKDYEGIVNLFTQAAERDFVEGKDRQNAFYTAAFILSAQFSEEEADRQSSGSSEYPEVDFPLILDLLNKAYDADPNSEFALNILDVIDSMKKASLIYEKEMEDLKNAM